MEQIPTPNHGHLRMRRRLSSIGITPGEGFPVAVQSPAMRRTVAYARKVARTPYPVLVQGETGSGKELIARGIHAASGRTGAFAPVNCGAIPEHLFEAELFGAVRGAYTGLDSDRLGLFRLADGGTLFLDEIAEMPQATQAKLLRVLSDGIVRPVGSSKSVRVDVRIVAATHQNLERLVENGRFRMDLFFRISAAVVALPALRERREDIPSLLEFAAAEAALVQGVPTPKIPKDLVALAVAYSWPGNVRELLHAVATALLRADGEPLAAEHFVQLSDASSASASDDGLDLPLAEARDRFERRYLEHLLTRTGGNLSEAARFAQTARSTLRDRLRRHGMALGTNSTDR